MNELLIARGYATWFDLTNMKGSTMDAMSDAIEGADVMLYGVSLRYKESANVCRSHNASCSTTNSQSARSLLRVRVCHERSAEWVRLTAVA